MSSSRTWMWGFLIAALLAIFWYRSTVFPKPSEPVTTRVAFITGGSTPYWQLAITGAETAAKDLGAEVTVFKLEKEEDLTEQQLLLIEAKSHEIDGMAVSPLDAESQTPLINKLIDEVHVVTFDSDAPLSRRQYFIGTSNYQAGEMCHQMICEALPDGGEVVVLMANTTKHNVVERRSGIEDSIETATQAGTQPVVSLVEFLLDQGDAETCKQNIAKALDDHPNLAGIIALNAYHGPILMELMETNSKLANLKLVTFDAEEATLDGVADGRIYGTLVQDPYMFGYEAVRMLVQLNQGRAEQVPIVNGGIVNIPCEQVSKDDVEDLRDRLKSRMNVTPRIPANKPQPSKSG